MSRPNAAQVEFWGGDPGRRWVTHHADLDHLHRGVADLVLETAELTPSMRVADIGCGGGALTLAAADRVGAGGEVLGLDISATLLKLAEETRREAGTANARFVEADAQTYAFDDVFDRVISRFGVMFFDDFDAGFANLRAALAPGGRLVAVVPESCHFRFDRRHVAFRAFVDDHGGHWIDLPPDTFRPSGTTVKTRLVVLYR